ncbi:hypothetical protein F5Y10DRAFT_293502 [Nemania abortiva]|nr:hypothetical protein F5Y10DRAFT_293502 [Nemania abortiva]
MPRNRATSIRDTRPIRAVRNELLDPTLREWDHANAVVNAIPSQGGLTDLANRLRQEQAERRRQEQAESSSEESSELSSSDEMELDENEEAEQTQEEEMDLDEHEEAGDTQEEEIESEHEEEDESEDQEENESEDQEGNESEDEEENESGDQEENEEHQEEDEPEDQGENQSAQDDDVAMEDSPTGNDEGHADPSPAVFPCDRCSKVFKDKGVLRQHRSDSHVGTRCYFPTCTFTADEELKLRNHFCEHQRDWINRGESETRCPWPGCTKNFSRKDTVQRCIKAHNKRAGGV